MLFVFAYLLAIAAADNANQGFEDVSNESFEDTSDTGQDVVTLQADLFIPEDMNNLSSGHFLGKYNEQPHVSHPNLVEALDTNPQEKQRAMYKLAFGYVPKASEPGFLASTKPIFQLDEDDLTVISTPFADVQRQASDSLESATRKLTAELGIEGSYQSAFTSTVSASAKTSRITNANTKAYRMDLFIKARKEEAYINAAYPHELMRPDAREFFLKESIERIVRDYGEFFVTKATLGGLLRGTVIKTLTSRADAVASEAQFSAGANGVLATLAVQGQAMLSNDEKRNFERCQNDYFIVGGEASMWLAMASPAMFDQTLQEWSDTVEPGKLGILSFRGLKPIWELLDTDDMNRTKAHELRSYLTKRWVQDAEHALAEELLNDRYLPTPAPTRPPTRPPASRRRDVVKTGEYMLMNAETGKYLNSDCWWNCGHNTNLNLYRDASAFRENRIFAFESQGSGNHLLRSKRGDLYGAQFQGSVKLASSQHKGVSAAKWYMTCQDGNPNDCTLQNRASWSCLAAVGNNDAATDSCSKKSARWILRRPR